MRVLKFLAHSKRALSIALKNGWLPGARYTNLRDIKSVKFFGNGFLDIPWQDYNFQKHVEITAETHPKITIARDVISINDIDLILKEAEQLARYAKLVALVPKDIELADRLEELIPEDFILAYSVPTMYGGTPLSTSHFQRPVHLLGGRPEVQRSLADEMNVISLDCNRFTYDAKYGDYFDGEIFRPHPIGGYEQCLLDSIKNINMLWEDYHINTDFLTDSVKEFLDER